MRDRALHSLGAKDFGSPGRILPSSTGTILYNVVDSAVGLIPVTRVSATVDALSPEFFEKISPGSPTRGSKLVEGKVYGTSLESSATQRVYDAKEMEGLPVGIQLVGGFGEEEKVIEGMKVVDRALGDRDFGPGKFAKRTSDEKRVY